jgi:cell division protein FtsI/penicillin-binding protein 2
MNGIIVAGKTGTAEAKEKFDEVTDDQNKRSSRRRATSLLVPLAALDRTDGRQASVVPAAPARNGSQLNHAWFIGFAPANDPQVAFAIHDRIRRQRKFRREACARRSWRSASSTAISSCRATP